MLVLLVIGTALRGYGGIPALFAGTALAGASIAVGNVLLPSLVKRDFAQHAATMTGLYTMALCGGAATAAALTLDRKSTRLNSITNAHLVCRLLIEKKKTQT